MRKWYLTLFACLLFALLLFPAVSLAAEATTVEINGVILPLGNYLYNDDSPVASKVDGTTIGYVHFTTENGKAVLEMHNAHIGEKNGDIGVKANGTLRLRLDDNTSNSIDSLNASCVELENNGVLTISGSGDLHLASRTDPGDVDACGISCGGLTVNGLIGRLRVTASGQKGYGIRTTNEDMILDGCDLKVNVFTTSGYAYGIFVGGSARGNDFVIDRTNNGNSDVAITAVSNGGTGYALVCNCLYITMKNSKLTASGSTAAMNIHGMNLDNSTGKIAFWAGDTAPGIYYSPANGTSAAKQKYCRAQEDKTTVTAAAHYGGNIVASTDLITNLVTYTATPDSGYVIDEVYIDSVKQTLTDAERSKYSHTFAHDDKAHFITVSFAYVVNFNSPANGTLTVSRASADLTSGTIVRGGEHLIISGTPTDTGHVLKLSVNGVEVTPVGNSYEYVVGTSGNKRTGGSYSFMGQGVDITASFEAAPPQLNAPTGLSWDGEKAKWQAVSNADRYSVQLFKNGTTAADRVGNDTTSDLFFDFEQLLKTHGAGSYYFMVTACDTSSAHSDSPASLSPEYKCYHMNIGNGAILIDEGSADNTLRLYSDGVMVMDNVPVSQTITITGTASQTIVVDASNLQTSSVSIAIDDLHVTTTSGAAFSIASGTSVSLAVIGTNSLTANGDFSALQVPRGASVTIDGSTGVLNATANAQGAGIGSFNDCGTITIDGATVNAVSNGNCAAIGTGIGDCGTITINNGVVNAVGHGTAAAIGTNSAGTGGSVKIIGGTLHLSGGDNAAAIGMNCDATLELPVDMKATVKTSSVSLNDCGEASESPVYGGQVFAYGDIGAAGDRYAKIEISSRANYSIVYKPGVSADDYQSDHIASKMEGAALTLLGAIYNRRGCTQTGWSDADGGAQTHELNGSYTADADLVLYPVWTLNASSATLYLTLDGSAYEGLSVALQGNAGTTYTLTESAGGEYANSAIPDGVYAVLINGSLTGAYATVNGVGSSLTINFYTVSFSANGGTPQPDAQAVIENGYAGDPGAMTNGTYTFDGWYSEPELTNKWDFAANKITGTTELYAGWKNEPGKTLPTPAISPAGGTYDKDVHVTLSCAEKGALIRYTTDGSEPTANSTEYGGEIIVSLKTVIKAKAFMSGMNDSGAAEAAYTIIPKAELVSGSATFVKGSGASDLVYRIGANISGFSAENNYESTVVDGTTLTASQATAQNGSIILTLSRDYLNTLSAGTHIAKVHLKGTGFAGLTTDITLTVTPETEVKLRITLQPRDQYAAVGRQATFTVAAEGSGVDYQWYIDRGDGTGWQKFSGSTAPQHVTTPVNMGCDGYRYRCRVTDSNNHSIDSGIAVLHVTKAPTPPVTGDHFAPALWFLLFLLGGIGMIVLIKKKTKT